MNLRSDLITSLWPLEAAAMSVMSLRTYWMALWPLEAAAMSVMSLRTYWMALWPLEAAAMSVITYILDGGQ